MSFASDTAGWVISILRQLLLLYQFALVAVIVLSWVHPDPYNPIVRALHSITDPVLDRFRGMIPLLGMIDLSPMILLLLIEFLRNIALPHLGALLVSQ